ncbi:MAG TPA: peptidylprolyl isomerase [Pseudomonas sp.]|uniref:peptidylprolyl isomerase n=1 Tax=Pseudomonas sp. TaxID=306 RepID=UPI002CAA1488|nr:peptidylprolyl isomerase [Pseudomonas sp.]HTO20608.1 peptidylprolyl isomerase [Pseudomonas sp.]
MELIDIQNLQDAPVPVIRVGAVEFGEADIARETPFHPAATLAEAQLQAARALVVRELLRQRAEVLGLSLRDADDDQTLAALLERELQVPEPDEAACRRFFEHNRQRFAEPLLLRVRHILLAAAPDDARARDGQYRLGQKLLRQLREAPERFTELAQRHSACPSKTDGGELGWLAPGQTVAELDRALLHLPIGLHERPLASRYGWHLIAIDERQEEKPLPYEQVAERVRHSLREQATRRALRHYLLALEEEIGVEGLKLDADADGALMR